MKIHRLWLGPDEMPELYVEFGRRWAELNPDDVLIDWTPDLVFGVGLVNQKVIDHIMTRVNDELTVEAAVQIADVIAYELVWRFGGLYVNVDIEPLRSLEYFRSYHKPGGDVYACYEDDTSGRIVNAVMGSPREYHPFWETVIKELPGRYFSDPTAEMVLTTGPALLTDCVKAWWRSGNPDFYVLPRRTFNPVHWSEVPLGGDASGVALAMTPEVCGVHHWGHRRTGRTNLVG